MNPSIETRSPSDLEPPATQRERRRRTDADRRSRMISRFFIAGRSSPTSSPSSPIFWLVTLRACGRAVPADHAARPCQVTTTYLADAQVVATVGVPIEEQVTCGEYVVHVVDECQ